MKSSARLINLVIISSIHTTLSPRSSTTSRMLISWLRKSYLTRRFASSNTTAYSLRVSIRSSPSLFRAAIGLLSLSDSAIRSSKNSWEHIDINVTFVYPIHEGAVKWSLLVSYQIINHSGHLRYWDNYGVQKHRFKSSSIHLTYLRLLSRL